MYIQAVLCVVCLCLPTFTGWTIDGSATALPSPVAATDPTAAEIRDSRVFREPLVSVDSEPTQEENRALSKALRAHSKRPIVDDFAAFELFIREHPECSWTPSLLFNLGLEYYQSGWYSKALDAWESAWPRLKPATDPRVKPVADRAAGELAYMYGRLGRTADLAALLQEVENRVFIGPATEKISGARQGLWTMQNHPEVAFRCGPFALSRILALQGSPKSESPLIRDSVSTIKGCSLSEVLALSVRLEMNLQMAFRSNNAPLLMPAVVHWKLGHYAALIREEGSTYLLEDPTFGKDAWVSRRVLETETSGFFLVAAGPLPPGWRPLTESEGRLVFGKGTTTTSDPDSTTAADTFPEECLPPPGMVQARTHAMVVSLNLRDIPVGHAPPVGPPVYFQATYNQREAGQPGIFTYAHLGPKWTFNWLAYITDATNAPTANVDYFTDQGGTLPFAGFNTNTQTYAPQVKTQAILKRTSTNSYEMMLRDGSRVIFNKTDGGGSARRVFMTQVIDPQGNSVQIGFDTNFCVVGVTNSLGQATIFSYEHPTDSRKITKVTDPFGRFATFAYDATGRLTNITDVIGLSSKFTYDGGDFIREMSTPYGITSFEKGENGRQRWLVTTFPNGDKQKTEYNEYNNITGIPASDPADTIPAGMVIYNGYLNYRNTFFWSRKAYAEAPNDYSRARLYHWLHQGNNSGGIRESEKMPLENRVWYNYDGQPQNYSYGSTSRPKAIGRVLDDGTTQLTRLAYDSVGNLTNTFDPSGRSLSFVYSTNQIDLLEVRQTAGGSNDLLVQLVYNNQHLPLAIRDAAGQWTTNTYNARGQLLTTRNPLGEITIFVYDPDGYLLALDGPLAGTNDSVRFTYDAAGRLRSAMDADGYSVTNSYDNLDRLTNVVFPDGTFMAFTFDRLDRVKARDRIGRETHFAYDALRRLVNVRDPLNRNTQFDYCNCGALAALTDPMGRVTRWEYDIQGRPILRQYPDGSRVIYAYDIASRLKSIRDEKGQTKTFDYYVDDRLRRVSYPLSEIPTPDVTYTYDSRLGRLLTIQDGTGLTTLTYHPPGTLGALRTASVDGPWGDDTITFQYDALGRATNRAVNGAEQRYAFDPLGRLTNLVNALGSFSYQFEGPSARILREDFPNGQSSHYAYDGNAGHRRLLSITHRKADNSVLSQFSYAYRANGSITNFARQLGVITNNWLLTYDNADQLTQAQVSAGPTFSYVYDPAGNRLSETTATNRAFGYNALNQLTVGSDTPAPGGVTYEWDAEQRLVAINRGTNRSEFAYDGLGRRVRIVERENGIAVRDRRFVWSGTRISEERDENGSLRKRFFTHGLQIVSGGPTGNYFYTRDHLGSLREQTDTAGAVRARYDYDPYGRPAKLAGDLEADWGFTGHFVHAQSGLNLTLFRAYDSGMGRWLSRDPLGESGGLNLYQYSLNDPVNLMDPMGLAVKVWFNDGREVVVSDASQLMSLLTSAPAGSINALRAEGHAGGGKHQFDPTAWYAGDWLRQNIPGLDSLPPFLTTPWRGDGFCVNGNDVMLVTPDGYAKSMSQFADRFADGAAVLLMGCNAAAGQTSMAQLLSNNLGQGVAVVGSTVQTTFSGVALTMPNATMIGQQYEDGTIRIFVGGQPMTDAP